MVLQQKHLGLSESDAALPPRHSKARIIDGLRHRNRLSSDENPSSPAADFIAGDADDALDKGHAGRKISSIFDQFTDRIRHVHEDEIAAIDGLIVKPIEADWSALRGVVDHFIREIEGRLKAQGKHRCSCHEKHCTIHPATFRAAR